MKNAFNGFIITSKEEKNFKIEGVLAIGSILLALYMRFEVLEMCILLLSWGVMLGAEMINTAIEETWDKLSPERDSAVGRIKDISAGAVFLIGFCVSAIVLSLFLSKIFVF